MPDHFKGINEISVTPTHGEILKHGKQRALTQAYLASVSFVDHCVGVVLNALEKSPHADDTPVVLWSDHGFHLGEKQHWARRVLWEESTKVPFLFAGPSFAFELGCSIRLSEGGTEVSQDCEDADVDERQTFDIGGMLGAGVGFPLSDRLGLMLSGGVDLGFRTLDTGSDPEDIKNRAFFGSAALTFPLGG